MARSRIVRTPWLVILLTYMVVFTLGALAFALLYSAQFVAFSGQSHPSSSESVHGNKLTLADALYFSVVTQTTLGYGDIAPVSGFARVLVCVQVFIFGLLLNGLLLGIVVAKVLFHTPSVVFSAVLTHQRGNALQFRFYFDHAIPVLNVAISCYLRLTPYPLGTEKRTPIQTRKVEPLTPSTGHEPMIETRAPIFVEIQLPPADRIAAIRESMYQAPPGEAAETSAPSTPAPLAHPQTPAAPAFHQLKKWDDIAVLVTGTRSDTGETIVGSKTYQFNEPENLLVEGSFRNIEISFITDGRRNPELIQHQWLNEID